MCRMTRHTTVEAAGGMAVTRDRFDAVLFDLDGVLTSTAAIHAAAWKRMFDRFLRERHASPDIGRLRRDRRALDERCRALHA